MDVKLFHAPDRYGEAPHLCAVAIGADPTSDEALLVEIRAALVKCQGEPTLLVLDDSVTVSWL